MQGHGFIYYVWVFLVSFLETHQKKNVELWVENLVRNAPISRSKGVKSFLGLKQHFKQFLALQKNSGEFPGNSPEKMQSSKKSWLGEGKLAGKWTGFQESFTWGTETRRKIGCFPPIPDPAKENSCEKLMYRKHRANFLQVSTGMFLCFFQANHVKAFMTKNCLADDLKTLSFIMHFISIRIPAAGRLRAAFLLRPAACKK